MDLRLKLAIASGRLAGSFSRNLGFGGGTTLPGEVASILDPEVSVKLSRGLPLGCAIVTGTNGKTTTARLIAGILSQAGWQVVHNRAGANLLNGVAAALVGNTPIIGRACAEFGLFEVDEATLPAAVATLAPRVVVVTNLFRDQLDRYGEVEYLANLWRSALAGIHTDSIAVLNADDPLVASLGAGLDAQVLYYGIEDVRLGKHQLEHASDSKSCLNCGSLYEYSTAYYGHLGLYRCLTCGNARPRPEVAGELVELNGMQGTRLRALTPAGPLDLQLRLPGLYNTYNALAAIAATLSLQIDLKTISAGIESFTAAFGRIERVPVEDKEVFLALVKNPVGFNQVLRTIQTDAAARPVAILINDHFADGTDVSWLWDVDFECLCEQTERIVVGGTRAEDMLVRLKYAGVPSSRLTLAKQPEQAIRATLEAAPSGATVYILPTYTAMLEVRKVFESWRCVERFWEN